MAFQQFLEDELSRYNLQGLIMSVSVGNHRKVVSAGNSMTGIPTQPNMYYRIGGQGIIYITTLFLILVEKRVFNLDDKIGKYLPRVPDSDRNTLRMLITQTANIPDYVRGSPEFQKMVIEHPFDEWSYNQLLNRVYRSTSLNFEPGTQFNPAPHTNTLLIGAIIEMVTHTSLADLLREYIFGPLNLKNTNYQTNPIIREPVFHSFARLRSDYLEESTYWNPSWPGYSAGVNSTAEDVNIAIRALTTGRLLPEKLYRIQFGQSPLLTSDNYQNLGISVGGFGLDCLRSREYPYPVFWFGELFNGYQGIWVYIPSLDVTINFEINIVDKNNDFAITKLVDDFLEKFPLDLLR